MREIYLIPAYGRVYKTQEEMIFSWEAGQDWKLYATGQYCSIRDLDKLQALGYVTLLDVRNNLVYKLGTARNESTWP